MRKVMAPRTLTAQQKRAFGRLVQQLSERGVDAAARVDLIADYVRLGDRLDELRTQEIGASGSEKMQVTRAIGVGVAERRRLHQQVFQGARPVALIPTQAEAEATDRQAAADREWRAYFSGDFTRSIAHLPAAEQDAVRKRRNAELEKEFGPPSWSALVDLRSANFLDEQNRLDAERRAAGLPVDDDDARWTGN